MICQINLHCANQGAISMKQCINHVIYTDDVCLLAPSAISLQQMLDVCFNFSIRNYIMFNPVKSVCITFQPK